MLSSAQLIWFLAPTVALCFQQHEVLTSQIPAARTRILTGLDKVELWTEQAIWDAVLDGIQIVVSTHAVLADAMTHGFVRISRLSLVIFDEGMFYIRVCLSGRKVVFIDIGQHITVCVAIRQTRSCRISTIRLVRSLVLMRFHLFWALRPVRWLDRIIKSCCEHCSISCFSVNTPNLFQTHRIKPPRRV